MGAPKALWELSQVLLADPTLTEAAALELNELLPEQLGPAYEAVIAIWNQRPADVPEAEWIERSLWSEPAHRATCQAIMMAWLFGAAPLRDSADPRWAQRWFEGQFWTYARSHVPGLSGGYLGYWSYVPEA